MATRSAIGGRAVPLLAGATALVTGDWVEVQSGKPKRTYHAVLKGTGALTASIVIEASNDSVNAVQIGTFALSGNGLVSDGGLSDTEWVYVRARVTALTGTGAAVSVTMGV